MPYSELASLRATRDIMSQFGLDTKKSLGQHFLIDDNIIGRIIQLAQIQPDDTVLEVGPGAGTLTVALLPRARKVVSIERDTDLAPVLAQSTALHSERFQLILKDALKLDACELDPSVIGAPAPRLLVANLPYAVAATIVLDYFQRMPFLQNATVMVQSEVADRMAAQPGCKDYGAYSVKLRLHARPAGRFQVSPGCFFPPPRVESAVLRLERWTPLFGDKPASPQLIQGASMAADAAFAQRRKNIRNSLQSYLLSRNFTKAQLDEALIRAEIEPGRRGETLSIDEFLALGNALLAVGSARQVAAAAATATAPAPEPAAEH